MIYSHLPCYLGSPTQTKQILCWKTCQKNLLEFISSLILEFPKTHIPHLNHFSEYSRLLKILGFISVVNSRAERTRTSVDYLVPNQVASPLADCPKKSQQPARIVTYGFISRIGPSTYRRNIICLPYDMQLNHSVFRHTYLD